MELFLMLLLAFDFCVHMAWGSPPENRNLNVCNIVDHIVSKLKVHSATPFCSSFLSIPVFTSVLNIASSVTVVETTSPETVSTVTDYTATVTYVVSTTATTATYTTVVTTDVITMVSTVETLTTSTLFTNLGRREAHAEPKIKKPTPPKLPSYLDDFASAAISIACSCLSIPESVYKTTKTQLSTIPTTAISSVTETIFAATTQIETTVILTNLEVSAATSTTLTVESTATIETTATDCPQAIQNPGFESGKSPSPWQVTSNVNEGTLNEVYSGVGPRFTHSGANTMLIDYFNSNGGLVDGSLIFSLSQTVNICPHQQLTLSFWLRWESYINESCNLEVCMGSQCNVVTVTMGSTSHDNQFVQYSILGPVPDGSTSMLISISADGGNAGKCFGYWLLFDDFTLV